jgi:hypothetical protein
VLLQGVWSVCKYQDEISSYEGQSSHSRKENIQVKGVGKGNGTAFTPPIFLRDLSTFFHLEKKRENIVRECVLETKHVLSGFLLCPS